MNTTAQDYHAQTIDPNRSESVWSPDKSSNVDVRRRRTTNSQAADYQRVLVGFCPNINRLDDFYFRPQDAEKQLKAIWPSSQDADLERLDAAPKIRELCWAKVNGQLFRAQVIDVNNCEKDGSCTVLYMDYGDKMT